MLSDSCGALAALGLLLSASLPAQAGVPAVREMHLTNVTPRGFTLVYAVSEPSSIAVQLYRDAAGQQPVTSQQLEREPFRKEDTATRAAQRNLGQVRIDGLDAGTAYYLRAILTSSATKQSSSWPSDGLTPLTTALEPTPFLEGVLAPGALVVQDVRPLEGTAAGSYAMLEIAGALSPLSCFVGDGTPSESALFDLSNLYGAGDRRTLRPAAGSSVVLTVQRDQEDAERRGYRLPDATPGQRAALEPWSQTLELEAGWTYFALEVDPGERAVETVLSPVSDQLREVWCHTPSTGWMAWPAQSEATPLSELPLRYGCLARLSAAGTVTLEGPRVLDPLPLSAGWNLVSFTLDEPLAIATGLAPGLDASIRSLWEYEPVGELWLGYDSSATVMNDLQTVQPEGVYWIELENAATWAAY